MTLALPPAEPPADAVADLLDKRDLLAAEIREAEALYLRLGACLDDDTLTDWQRRRLEVELAVAGRRLELYGACREELRRQLAAAGVAA